MAVNKRTGTGAFGDRNGTFEMRIRPADTITISARDYHTLNLCFRDSTWEKGKIWEVKLEKKPLELKTIEIRADREFTEIEKDIQRLEKRKTSSYSEYGSLESPITALYERFSRIERQKQKVAELEYEDAKRDLLRELLAKYVKGDIISLSEEEFDDFIFFCNPDMNFLRSVSQYDLIMYFKIRFEEYSYYVRGNRGELKD